MSAEATALLALLRDGAEPGPELDAQALAALAATHQVDALAHLRWPGTAQLPAARSAFRLAYLHHMLRNEHLVRNLAELEAALAERGIESLVFKGPWLAFVAWPDPATRPVDDIDLGVRERDYRGAVETLESLGYRAATSLPRDASAALRRSHYGEQLRFVASGRRPVELHFRMINVGPPSEGEPWLWRDARPLNMGARVIRVPGPADMLLHVLLHANQHGFAILRLLFDVRYAIDRIDAGAAAPALIEHAGQLRCRAAAYFGLALASELAGAKAPSTLLAALRPSGVRRLAFERVWGLARARRLDKQRAATDLEAPRFYLWEMGSLRDKLRYLGGVIAEAGGPLQLLRRARAARQVR